MIRQCAFSYSIRHPLASLRVWPLSIFQDVPHLFVDHPADTVICAIDHEAHEEGVSLPRREKVPGRLCANGFAKKMSKQEALDYLSQASGPVEPIDLLMLFTEREPASREDFQLIKLASLDPDSGCAAKAVCRLNATLLAAHDGVSVTIETLTKTTLFEFYRKIVSQIVPGVETGDVRKCWHRMVKDYTRAQILTGYSSTIYIRSEPLDVIECQRLNRLLAWDLKKPDVSKAGSFNPDFNSPIANA